MINFSATLYGFDPVQCIFQKSNYQTDIEASNQFPNRIRIEKRKIEYLNCDIVLTEFTGIRWNLITGLQPVKKHPGYLVGNKVLKHSSCLSYGFKKRETEMLVIHNNGLTGKLILYHFPNYDTNTSKQRMNIAKEFISILSKKIGQS